ncbi:WD40 repeat domain-containing protein [Streptomyces seoulensis]|uniref:WD40 repeat domain-containing protein n=1 Tax=Streptomyces seoulensis TaxID=73044 RepID=UPI0033BC5E0C
MTGQEPPDRGQRIQPDDREIHHVHQIASADQGSHIHQAGRDLSILNVFYSDRHTRSLLAADRPLATSTTEVLSPYRGLGAFRTGDARFFFGREAAVERVRRMVSSSAVDGTPVVVSGASGSGKSSLLQAGVIPRIREKGLDGTLDAARWPCLLMRPTADPFAELAHGLNQLQPGFDPGLASRLAEQPDLFASAVRHLVAVSPSPPAGDHGEGSQRLLLIIDQFEQLFTLCRDESVRKSFVSALNVATRKPMTHGMPPAVVLIVAVRADFEARCAEYEALAQSTQDRFLLTSMTARQLEIAITEPPKRLGGSVDRDLVAHLLTEVSRRPNVGRAGHGEPGAGVLPLLSYALDEAWRQQDPPHDGARPLSLTDYERTGGLELAVARSAQTAFGRLTDSQQIVAKAVFLRLTRTTPEGIDTSAPAARIDFVAMGKSVEAVLDAFAEERLITLSSETVEISHEALLSAWPDLRRWLEESRTQRIVVEKLRSTALAWEVGEERSYLYGGLQLVAAVNAVDALGDQLLGHLGQKFLAASKKAEKRRSTVRRTVFGSFVALSICLALLVAFVQQARTQAVRQRNAAVSARLVNKSEETLSDDPTGARLDTLAAREIAPASATTRYGLENALANRLLAVIPTEDTWITKVALNGDGSTLVFDGFGTRSDGTVTGTVDVGTRTTTLRRPSATPGPAPVPGQARSSLAEVPDATAVSGDGSRQATRQKDGSVIVTERAGGKRVARIDVFGDRASPLALNYDGSVAALVKDDSSVSTEAGHLVRLVSVSTGLVLDTLTSPGKGRIHCVAFSANGRRLAVGTEAPAGSGGGDGGHFTVWDLSPGRVMSSATVPIPTAVRGYFSLWLGDGGGVVATAHRSGVALIDPENGTRRILDLRGGQLQDLAFSSDGTRVAVLASGSDPPAEYAYMWDFKQASATPSQVIDVVGFQAHGISLSDDGKVVSVAGDQLIHKGRSEVPRSMVRFWRLAPSTFQPAGSPLTGARGFASLVDLTADGERAVVATQSGAGGTGTLSFWDVARGRRIGSVVTLKSQVHSLAMSHSGSIAASADARGQVRLWDPHRGIEVGAPLEVGTTVNAVHFSSDDSTLATGDESGHVQLWDVATRLPIGDPFTVGQGAVIAKSLAFTDHDTRLVAATQPGEVVSIDIGFLGDAQSELCRQVGRLMTARWWTDNVPELPAVTATHVCAHS